MLVLTRKVDETIIVGNPADPSSLVAIRLFEITGTRVRIGLHAPKHAQILRFELLTEEQRQAIEALLGNK
jgi:carbon storage regulator CsrA